MKLLEDLMTGTYNGNYKNIISTITEYLKNNTDAKITIQKIAKDKANIIATFGKPKLVINCHMDTVPPQGNWNQEPTQLTEHSGKIYGLGAADTKGNIFSLLKAASNAKPKNLMLLFSVDEEKDSIDTGVNYFLKSDHKKDLKYAIVCEPTSLKYANRHKGYYAYRITVKSKPHHSSIKIHGSRFTQNAITKASEIIQELDKAGFNIGKITGGTQANIIAEHCEFTISIRTYETPKIIRNTINSITKNDPNTIINTLLTAPPLNPAVCKIPYIDEEMHEVGFWTDAALFSKEGINSVVFGAGNIAQAHTENEYVYKNDLEKAQVIFEKIMGEIK